jgi:uncharacterized protein
MGKFIVLLVIVALIVWIARGGRGRKPVAPPPADALPDTMVACAQCGVHLPKAEALPGRGGAFCCEAHRAAFEGGQGKP